MREMIRIDISRIENETASVLRKHEEIAGAYLFGSALEECRPDSDIDIGLILMPGKVGSDKDCDLLEARIYKELSFDKHPLDLVFLNLNDAFFSFQVIKTGKLILYET